MVVCKNCGHPVGKVPRGLYVLRENAFHNIRISSSGFHWLHLVKYDGDRKMLGTARVPQYLEELKDTEEELDMAEKEGHISGEEAHNLERRLLLLKEQSERIVDMIKGPERDSRMFTIRCWGKNGRCKCENAEPGDSDDIQNRRDRN